MVKFKKISGKKISFLLLASFLVIFCGVLICFNAAIYKPALRPVGSTQFCKATVTEVISSDVSQSKSGELEGDQKVRLTVTSGKYSGKILEAVSPHANHSGAYCVPGLRVVALVGTTSTGTLTASVYNYDRAPVLWGLIALFLGLLCLIGGRKGITSALALVFTFICIAFFYIPLMYVGVSPFLAASVTAVLITVVSMLLVGGWSQKTFCAVLGTIAGVLAAGMVAVAFGAAGHISGLNVSEMETLSYISQKSGLDVSGILFSGILISSLGAVLDVSMSVASAVSEIHAATPALTRRQLFQSGMNVGRDMMGTMSSTLILAYAGSSVNTLVIIYAYSMTYLQVMNGYEIGIEILSGLSGSIGVILTVPLVSFVTAALAGRKTAADVLKIAPKGQDSQGG